MTVYLTDAYMRHSTPVSLKDYGGRAMAMVLVDYIIFYTLILYSIH